MTSEAVQATGVRVVDVLIVGAGQAGLGAAHWLAAQSGLDVLVVDRAPIGQSWLDRWDSLTLFTPRHFSSLPGAPFPDGPGRCPTRVEMADYLRDYAADLGVPVETGVTVTRLTRGAHGLLTADTSSGQVVARHVVLSTGPFHLPFVPPAADGLDGAVTQLHSYGYARACDVPSGDVLVVGGGNSAAQLAVELARTHRVTVASPAPPWYLPEDIVGVSMYWWTYLTRILNAPAQAWISRYIRRRGDAVVGTELRELVRRGAVQLHPHRVVSCAGRQVTLADGTTLGVSTVLWCTGFRPDTGWIEIDGAVDDDGAPLHDRGASPVAGLHWMGLPWQTRLNSSIINGVDRDARELARRISVAG